VESAPRIENPYRDTFADLPDPVAKEPQAEPEQDREANTFPEPEPSAEAPPESPVEVSDKTERDALVGEIKAALSAQGSTVAKFAPLCREAGLLAVGVQLAAAPMDDLREILTNVADILTGDYIPLD
jgi:hypothetical protein